MKVLLQYGIETDQNENSLREAGAQALEKAGLGMVFSRTSSPADPSFLVRGVDTTQKTPVEVNVQATDSGAAQAQVEKDHPHVVVNHVEDTLMNPEAAVT